MMRNWLVGATVSATLHGGAAAVFFLTNAAAPAGAETPLNPPRAIQIELVDMLRRDASDLSQGLVSAPVIESSASPDSRANPTSDAGASKPPTDIQGGGQKAAEAATADPGAVSDYYRKVENHLVRFHAYPADLVSSRPSGVVRVGLIVQRDGRIMDAWVENSSGVARLDDAALKTLRRAEPLPRLPANLPGAIDLIVPMRYAADMGISR